MANERALEVPARFYRTEMGTEPVLEWLRGLERGDLRAIGVGLMRVQFGWPIGMPLVRSLKDGLWEVRSTLPSQPDCAVDSVFSPGHFGCDSWLH